jgi:hypothetical protein
LYFFQKHMVNTEALLERQKFWNMCAFREIRPKATATVFGESLNSVPDLFV